MSNAETRRLIAEIHSISAKKVTKGNKEAQMDKLVRLNELLYRLRKLHPIEASLHNEELTSAQKKNWNNARKMAQTHKKSPKKNSLCKRLTGCSIQGGKRSRTRKSRK